MELLSCALLQPSVSFDVRQDSVCHAGGIDLTCCSLIYQGNGTKLAVRYYDDPGGIPSWVLNYLMLTFTPNAYKKVRKLCVQRMAEAAVGSKELSKPAVSSTGGPSETQQPRGASPELPAPSSSANGDAHGEKGGKGESRMCECR